MRESMRRQELPVFLGKRPRSPGQGIGHVGVEKENVGEVRIRETLSGSLRSVNVIL